VFRPYSTGICPVAVIEGATHREGAAAALKHSLGRPLRLSLSRLVNCCRASHPFADLVGIDLPGGSYRDRHSHHRLPIVTISAMSASGADGSPRPTNGRYRRARPFPCAPTKVPKLNRQRALSLARGNGSSCPIPVIAWHWRIGFECGSGLDLARQPRTPLQEWSEEEAFVWAGIGGPDCPLA